MSLLILGFCLKKCGDRECLLKREKLLGQMAGLLILAGIAAAGLAWHYLGGHQH